MIVRDKSVVVFRSDYFGLMDRADAGDGAADEAGGVRAKRARLAAVAAVAAAEAGHEGSAAPDGASGQGRAAPDGAGALTPKGGAAGKAGAKSASSPWHWSPWRSRGEELAAVPAELLDDSSRLSVVDPQRIESLDAARVKLGRLLEERKRMKGVLREYYATDNSLLCTVEREPAPTALESPGSPASMRSPPSLWPSRRGFLQQPQPQSASPVPRPAGVVQVLVHVVALCDELPDMVLAPAGGEAGGRLLLGGEQLPFGSELEAFALSVLARHAVPDGDALPVDVLVEPPALFKVESKVAEGEHSINLYVAVSLRSRFARQLPGAVPECADGADGAAPAPKVNCEWVAASAGAQRVHPALRELF